MNDYGRVNFVSEVEQKEINKYNGHRVTKSDKRCLIVSRKIDDFKIARELNITIAELNHGGVYQ